jgi:hypothetical protein
VLENIWFMLLTLVVFQAQRSRSRLWGRVESVVIARGMASLFVTLHELTRVQNLPNKKQKTCNTNSRHRS